MLTKSLHTVTAVTKVALYLYNDDASHLESDERAALDAEIYVGRALDILGYSYSDYNYVNDTTIRACVKAVTKAMQS